MASFRIYGFAAILDFAKRKQETDQYGQPQAYPEVIVYKPIKMIRSTSNRDRY
jgi:hypothetical protein